jgi:predicted RND superfamily exporter protein
MITPFLKIVYCIVFIYFSFAFLLFLRVLRSESNSPIIIPENSVISSMRHADMETDQKRKLICITAVFW